MHGIVRRTNQAPNHRRPFFQLASCGMRRQNLPHQKGRDAKEVGLAFVVGTILPDQLQIDRAEQGGWMQR